eukprot:CCRYP_005644-RB/>CCRYP_005644-RB protein AED:0.66 eAED:0.46 QI:0/-1/0/1/-1/0/1/0/123
MSNPSVRKRWTCGLTGYKTAAPIKSSFDFWRPRDLNYGDYWTKHNSPTHHRNMRCEILTPMKVLLDLRQGQARAIPASKSTKSGPHVQVLGSIPNTRTHSSHLLQGCVRHMLCHLVQCSVCSI